MRKKYERVDYKTFFVLESTSAKEEVFNYYLSENSDVRIALHQATGKMIKKIFDKKQMAGEYMISINIEGLPNGMYFIKSIIIKNKKMFRMDPNVTEKTLEKICCLEKCG